MQPVTRLQWDAAIASLYTPTIMLALISDLTGLLAVLLTALGLLAGAAYFVWTEVHAWWLARSRKG